MLKSVTLSLGLAVALSMAISGSVFAQESKKIEDLEKKVDALSRIVDQLKKEKEESDAEKELEELRRFAEDEAKSEEVSPDNYENKKFRFKGLGLQKLNPEISLVADMLFKGKYVDVDNKAAITEADKDYYDSMVRMVGLHFQGYLDPYTKLFVAFPVTQSGTQALGEAYITRFGLSEGVNLTVGKFRQQFCTVNRWHKPAQDQTDYPYALRSIFGGGGLGAVGFGLDGYFGKSETSSHKYDLQLTEAGNGNVWGRNTKTMPSMLGRYLWYRDISKNSYIESGLSAVTGWKDTWTVSGVDTYDAEPATVYGFEFNYLWEPTDRMRHRNFEWRNEFYLLKRKVLIPDGSGKDEISAWGGFTALQTKVSRKWDIGLRAEIFQPDVKKYDVADFSGHAVQGTFGSAYNTQISPYITWHQSPWVKLRLQFDAIRGHHMGDPEYALTLQVVVALGPHLHERY